MRVTLVRRGAGGGSLLAALVHGGLAPQHLSEWWGYGLLFLVAAACQVVLALALLIDPLPPTDPAAPRVRRWIDLAGGAGNLLLAALYVVSRVVGVPLGPDAGQTQPWDTLGIVTVVVEVAVGVALFALRGRAPGSTPQASPEG